MDFIKKINTILRISPSKSAEGAEVWIVSWDARYGEFNGQCRRVAKAFLKEEDAQAYADSIKSAKSLLQYTENIRIRIDKQQ